LPTPTQGDDVDLRDENCERERELRAWESFHIAFKSMATILNSAVMKQAFGIALLLWNSNETKKKAIKVE